MFDWNDLKYLLAVARHGSTLAAARALDVNQSTVQRHVAELEAQLSLRFFERLPAGYKLTETGQAVLAAAENVAAAIADLERAFHDVSRASILRLTCPEPIAIRLAQSGMLERFHGSNPGIRLEFVLADRYVDLSKGEADVALRSGDTVADLVGRKVADSIWAVYASRAYVEQHGAPASVEELAHHPLIGFDKSVSGHRLSIWLDRVAPDARYAALGSSVLGLVSAAKAGVGVAALPVALGGSEPDLVRLFGPVHELTRAWRLLAHRDVRRQPRVKAFFDFVASERAALKPILTG